MIRTYPEGSMGRMCRGSSMDRVQMMWGIHVDLVWWGRSLSAPVGLCGRGGRGAAGLEGW